MPVADSFNCVMTPEARADMAAIESHGRKAGVSFASGTTKRSQAKIVHYGLSLAVDAICARGRGAAPSVQAPRPAKERIEAIMAARGLSMTGVDREAGVAKGTARNVVNGAPLETAGGGALLAWVEQAEVTPSVT